MKGEEIQTMHSGPNLGKYYGPEHLRGLRVQLNPQTLGGREP